ncbi:pyrroloquinoline quinone biosynthesis protein PqqB [Paenibacillus sp. FJAT-27812]|uniref:pyrroloquinoline quinone biosynthesis protein PqqB n=1 Tax=Paenibacillus sp. FJAT-27812 TaxID=1684143 RepID=UPI0007C782C7|nr:pyrroloquinoline quinone biosynthesis protein PqqB [Paenibacillus sp. FJAT-27812]
MLVKVLGSAAGGGFPQWNCACRYCSRARERDSNVKARMHNALALSLDGQSWYLLNATPDIREQIEAHCTLWPGPGLRDTPLLGVLLTDAELDHTLGLLSLREGAELEIYASAPVLHALSYAFPVRKVLEPYAKLRWQEVKMGEPLFLFEGNVVIRPFYLGCKSPRYVAACGSMENDWMNREWVIGYRIEDLLSGGVAVYAPGIESWTTELEQNLAGAHTIFIDGTFWQGDELRNLGISELGAADMGHIPITGSDGSLQKLISMPASRKIYIHINNTNPVLDQASIAYRRLQEQGIEVGYDGMEMEV